MLLYKNKVIRLQSYLAGMSGFPFMLLCIWHLIRRLLSGNMSDGFSFLGNFYGQQH